MNCEQVEELLSAYLDNMLAPEERRQVADHFQTCRSCAEVLVDYRRNDALLKHLSRVTPDAALRERIFSAPEYLEATGEPFASEAPSGRSTVPRLPASSRSPRRDTPGRPHLVAIPGGRSTAPRPTVKMETPPARERARSNRTIIATIAAALIIAIGLGAFAGISLLSRRSTTATHPGFTPPANAPQASGPLSAGARFVFLRGNVLWSERSDGSSTQPDQLTPANVDVSPNWAVATFPGRATGNMLAYIDLKKGSVHIIRSDGQEDTTINPPLLNASVSPASVQDTATWANILNSLTWSPDGTKLAFVADPAGTGQTHLYIYSTATGKTTQVSVSTPGSVSRPTWSPDGARIAFEVSHQDVTGIFDYNTQINSALTIADGIGAKATAGQSILSLDWSPDTNVPAITWSLGSIGHVRSVWVRHVGVDSAIGAQQLLAGDFAQAIYSRSGHAGVGSWMIVTTIAGRAGDIWRIDVTPGATRIQLTAGKQVNFATWSPDGSFIDYLASLSEGVGVLHIVNASTAVDAIIANGVTYDPAPAWSMDSRQVAYSTGTRIGIASPQTPTSPRYLTLKGAASALVWSASKASLNQLIVAMNDVQQGIYLVDTQHNTTFLADKLGTDGPILWTVIP
ncbi:MAG TPA: zf-HC2 domain-containing protein [Ktedonobacteraceae bacterium]|nr:zf-HC2 domain-containing protein [Ktedonobacteraceae bacterium]